MYRPTVICIVCSLASRRLRRTRAYLARSLDRLLPDDGSWCPESPEVRSGCEAAADILSGSDEPQNLGETLERAVRLMTAEESDSKHVFVVIDDLPNQGLVERQLSRATLLDKHEAVGCRFHVLDMGTDKPWLQDLCRGLDIEYVVVGDDPGQACDMIRERYLSK